MEVFKNCPRVLGRQKQPANLFGLAWSKTWLSQSARLVQRENERPVINGWRLSACCTQRLRCFCSPIRVSRIRLAYLAFFQIAEKGYGQSTNLGALHQQHCPEHWSFPSWRLGTG